MKQWTRTMMYEITILVVLVVSAMYVLPVRADDGAPPPPDPSVETAKAAVDLSEVPAGTDVVVLDKHGKKVSLATQQAADILGSGGDPMWCPTGTAPGSATCSPQTTSFQGVSGLLSWLAANDPGVAGTIWVEKNYVASTLFVPDTDITLDPSFVPTMANFALTIKGGWNGCPTPTTCTSTVDTTSPSQFDNGSLSILGWNASVTLSDILVSSASTNPNGTFDGQYPGLVVTTTSNISLNRVESNSNTNGGTTMAGAYLDNTSGTGNVTVTNSHFNSNDHWGLEIFSHGTVTLKNVAADKNVNGDGAYISNSGASIAKAVTVSNSEFKGDGNYGLEIGSLGAITLTNITAINNTDRGVYAFNNFTNFSSPITLKGVNNFSHNGADGLTLFSYGAITINSVTADSNGGDGAYLDNSGALTAKSVTITGSLTAVGNADSGLVIYSKGLVTTQVVVGGVIKKANLTLNDNGVDGAFIDNCRWNGGTLQCDGTGGVTLTGFNVFKNNGAGGLYIGSRGAIMLANLTVIHNGYGGSDDRGVWVNGCHSTDTTYLNCDVAFNTAIQPSVTISGNNLFDSNSRQGLAVSTYGAITLSNIVALNNGKGIVDHSGSGVLIQNEGGTFVKPVTFKGTNVFNGNDSYGLVVDSEGAITLSNVTASYNSGGGAYLLNSNLPVQSKVTITGYGVFERNGTSSLYDGLNVSSHGAITLANISADYNYGHGAYLTTTGITGGQAVTLTGTNNFICNGLDGRTSNDCTQSATSNGGAGLVVLNDGNIKVSNLTASDNTFDGAWLDNASYWTTGFANGTVTLTGFGNFDHNFHPSGAVFGLRVNSRGSVTLNRVSADENSAGSSPGAGVNVTSVTGNITLVCSSAYGNTGTGTTGLTASTPLTLTLIGWYSYYNSSPDNLSFLMKVTKPCP